MQFRDKTIRGMIMYIVPQSCKGNSVITPKCPTRISQSSFTRLKKGSKNATTISYVDSTFLFLFLNITVSAVYTTMKKDKIARCLTEKAGVANRGGTALINEKKHFNPSIPITILQSKYIIKRDYNCTQLPLTHKYYALWNQF
jgi:hypothetical protein